MKKILLILIVLVAYSCSHHVTNVVSIKDLNPSTLSKIDTVGITYDFWSNGGKVQFTITNISTRPIYIDWKKSILFMNNTSYSYWEDKAFVNSLAVYYGNMAGSKSTISKAERIMFIAPNSKYTFTKTGLVTWYKGFTSTQNIMNFKYEETPMILRNYLTFSYKESFEEEFYIDNSFWVPQITTMTQLEYCGKDKNLNCSYPTKSPYTYFYDLEIYRPTNKKGESTVSK